MVYKLVTSKRFDKEYKKLPPELRTETKCYR